MDIKRRDCAYTALFCEENVWLLARKLVEQGWSVDALQVLLFTNAAQQVLLFNQRVARPGQAAIWDYHVVLRAIEDDADWLLDQDTRLPFPVATKTYLQATFPAGQHRDSGLAAKVRVIPATSYLQRLSSDRSHMLGRAPRSAFPRYPPIVPDPSARPITLSQYRNIDALLDDGSRVLALSQLAQEAAVASSQAGR